MGKRDGSYESNRFLGEDSHFQHHGCDVKYEYIKDLANKINKYQTVCEVLAKAFMYKA